MAQFVTRIDDDLAAAVDRLIEDGIVASRSEAVRHGLAQLVDRQRRLAVGRAIVDAYTRVPQTASELGWSDEAARRMIAEEPW